MQGRAGSARNFIRKKKCLQIIRTPRFRNVTGPPDISSAGILTDTAAPEFSTVAYTISRTALTIWRAEIPKASSSSSGLPE